MTFVELQIGDAFSMTNGASVGVKTSPARAFIFQRRGSVVVVAITEVVKLDLRIFDRDGELIQRS